MAPVTPLELQASALALLVFIGERDHREEPLWVRVSDCLQHYAHRAYTLPASALSHDLPQGEII